MSISQVPFCSKKSLSDGASLRRTTAETVANFLLGAAWAIALLGAVYLFWSFLPFGYIIAFMAAIVGSLLGLLLVVFLEIVFLQFEKLREMKRQTDLLEEIRKELHDSKICDN